MVFVLPGPPKAARKEAKTAEGSPIQPFRMAAIARHLPSGTVFQCGAAILRVLLELGALRMSIRITSA
jgi:hypothetical protein